MIIFTVAYIIPKTKEKGKAQKLFILMIPILLAVIATVLLAIEHGEPLDEVAYCEVMFDDSISGEIPEHRDFIYEKAKAETLSNATVGAYHFTFSEEEKQNLINAGWEYQGIGWYSLGG